MLNFFRIGEPPGNLVLVDAPGYGARGRREWGALFDAYIEQRKEYVWSVLKLSDADTFPLLFSDFDASIFSLMPSMVSAILMKRCCSLSTKNVKARFHCKLSSPKPIQFLPEMHRRPLPRCGLRYSKQHLRVSLLFWPPQTWDHHSVSNKYASPSWRHVISHKSLSVYSWF
jgi:hypothetical protein